MARFQFLLAALFLAFLTAEVTAAPLRRFDMAKSGRARRVVKRTSADASSPLQNLIKKLQFNPKRIQAQANAVQDDKAAIASQINEQIQDIVRLVKATPLSTDNTDTGAMQDAYQAGIAGLAASASSSSAAPRPSSADADTAAMQIAYEQGIAGLAENKKRSFNKRSESLARKLALKANKYKRQADALSSSLPAAPTPTLVNVEDQTVDIANFPTITETVYLVPTPVVETSWSAPSASGASSVEIDVTRLGYLVETALPSAPASASSASGSVFGSASGAHFMLNSSVDFAASSSTAAAATTTREAYVPIRHGSLDQ